MITNPVGVIALSRREILRFLIVASQTIFPPLVSSALLMFIFGVAIGSRIDFSHMGLTYIQFIVPGLMTMHLISSSYENTTSSLFIARWHNHIQEVLLAPLSYFEMVLGLLAGGVVRGIMVCCGVYLISLFFSFSGIQHPFILLYFMITISVIFACAGMIGALWAEDFNMLSMWNIYVIMPLIFMGGVFHPIKMLPQFMQTLSVFNPMFYLVQGMRYSLIGVIDTSIVISMLLSGIWASGFFFWTVYLFKTGYKLRT